MSTCVYGHFHPSDTSKVSTHTNSCVLNKVGVEGVCNVEEGVEFIQKVDVFLRGAHLCKGRQISIFVCLNKFFLYVLISLVISSFDDGIDISSVGHFGSFQNVIISAIYGRIVRHYGVCLVICENQSIGLGIVAHGNILQLAVYAIDFCEKLLIANKKPHCFSCKKLLIVFLVFGHFVRFKNEILMQQNKAIVEQRINLTLISCLTELVHLLFLDFYRARGDQLLKSVLTLVGLLHDKHLIVCAFDCLLHGGFCTERRKKLAESKHDDYGAGHKHRHQKTNPLAFEEVD